MRFGVVGTNFVSDSFMQACTPAMEITAVASGHRDHAESFAKKYGIGQVYDNLEEMLAKGQCEAIYLATPNAFHGAMTKQCIEAGVPVICEKPFATNSREVEEVLQLAEAKKVYVHDAIIPLYTANFERLKQALPQVGTIRRAVFNFTKYSSRYKAYLEGANPTTFRRELANGSAMDLGVYCLADVIALFGRPTRVQAQGVLLDTGVDGLGSMTLSYPGFEALITHGKICTSTTPSEIQGEKGTLIIEGPSLIQSFGFLPQGSKEKEILSVDNPCPFRDQLEDFMESQAEGRLESKRVPHATTRLIHEVLTECRRQMGVIYPQDEEHA